MKPWAATRRRRRLAGASGYARLLATRYGATEVWPLVDITTGTEIPAILDRARAGTLTGWDLQNTPGPVPGTLAPYADGVNDHGDFLTASLVSAFDPEELSAFLWIKIPAAAWTDGTTRYLLRLKWDGGDAYLIFLKLSSANGVLAAYYTGVENWVSISANTAGSTAWLSMAITCSVSAAAGAGEAKVYFNGSQEGSTAACPGLTAANALDLALLGASTATPSNVHAGWLAYLALKFGAPVWTPAEIAAMHAAAAAAGGV